MVKRKRLVSIDFLRFGAIFLMFWDHAVKLFYSPEAKFLASKQLTQLSRQILGWTSLSSALFLFLLGFCLVLSCSQRQEKFSTWFWQKWRRGIWLIFLSYLLFFYKYRLEVLYAVSTSGILQLLGLGLMIGSLFLLIPSQQRSFWLVFTSLIILISTLGLQQKGLLIPPLNAYIFPVGPNLAYVLGGILVAEKSLSIPTEKRTRFFYSLMAVTALGAGVFLSATRFDPYPILTSHWITEGFWQPSVELVIFNFFLITFSFAVLGLVEKKIRQITLIRAAARFGQEALNIYVLHILVGWGVARYLLPGLKFGFWAPLLAVTGFMGLGVSWLNLKSKYFLKSNLPGSKLRLPLAEDH